VKRSAFGAVLALAVAAGSANAAFFSFASDRNPDGPTFSGNTSRSTIIRDGRPFDADNQITITFLVDRDEDGPGAPEAIESRLEFEGDIGAYLLLNRGSRFLHTWDFEGGFRVIEQATNQTIFQASFGAALLTSLSESRSNMGVSATIENNVDADPSLTFTTGGRLADLDVSQSQSFAFTLTNLRQQGNALRVPVVQNNFGGDGPWISEGSFSARAIPTPGALALAGMGVLVAGRRRR
jgi:hypothetical protein